jgi:transposase-like protein
VPKRFPTSLPDFQHLFPDEEHCATYLEETRWPEGFQCPHCGWEGDPFRFEGRPGVLRCRNCGRDISLTAGTVMHRSHTPLCTWFWGAYLVTSHTPGVSAVQFQRQLGLSRYETAFQMLHKLRAGMVRPERDRIGAEWPVEVDETYVGGKTRGEGKGVHHRTLVAGAVEIRTGKEGEKRVHTMARPRKGKTYAGRLRLKVISARTKLTLEDFVTESVEPGAEVITDGYAGYDGLPKLGYYHTKIVMEGDPERADEWLPMIHLVFSNLKAWLLGTHHGVSPQHLQAYLNEFTFRFNRRFYPFTAFNSLLGIGVRVEAPTYEALYSGEYMHPNPGPEKAMDYRRFLGRPHG